MRALGIAIIILGLAPLFAVDTYVQIELDPSGQLYIRTKNHREITPKKEAHQVGFDKAAIAPDGRSVGWLALYPNPDTTYPIPLKLVVYENGTLHTFTGTDLPIWEWCFEAGGKQVAFEQETVHGEIGVHYELRDVASERLVEKYDPDPNAQMAPKPPRWVVDVGAKP
jgi:hypothetical protein